jgi:hypothetical protein
MAVASKPVIITLEDAMSPTLRRVDAAMWPASIKHLSPSSIKKFLTCPEQWRKHYLHHESEPVGYYLFQGSVNHRTIDWGLRQKMNGDRLPEVKEILERFDHEWTTELAERGGASEIVWRGTNPSEAKKETAGLVRAYLPIAQTLNPIALEEMWRVDVPLVPVPLLGKIDIELADRLVDRKETARRERIPKPDWIMQGGIYSAVKHKPIDFHVSTKTKMPMVYTPGVDPDLAQPAWSTRRMETYVQRVARMISMIYMQYGPDDVWPPGTMHTWACNLCGYRPSCAWWAE